MGFKNDRKWVLKLTLAFSSILNVKFGENEVSSF